MHVIYETLYGSRLFGTHTAASDRDVKYIYLPKLSDLVLGQSIKNVFVTTNTKTKNTSDDVDTEYVAVQAFFLDLFSGKNYALDIYMSMLAHLQFESIHGQNSSDYAEQKFNREPEWLFDEFENMLFEFRTQFLTSDVQHILGFAITQANRYEDRSARLTSLYHLKDFFDVKPSKSKVHQYEHEIAEALKLCDAEEFYVGTYLADKLRNTWMPCIYVMGSMIPFTTSVEKALEVLNAKVKQYGSRVHNASKGVDWRSLHHAIRSGYTCISFLKNGEYSLPFNGSELARLMAIKQEECSVSDVKDELNLLIAETHLLSKKPHPSLKQSSQELHDQFKCWLSDKLVSIYKRLD